MKDIEVFIALRNASSFCTTVTKDMISSDMAKSKGQFAIEAKIYYSFILLWFNMTYLGYI